MSETPETPETTALYTEDQLKEAAEAFMKSLDMPSGSDITAEIDIGERAVNFIVAMSVENEAVIEVNHPPMQAKEIDRFTATVLEKAIAWGQHHQSTGTDERLIGAAKNLFSSLLRGNFIE